MSEKLRTDRGFKKTIPIEIVDNSEDGFKYDIVLCIKPTITNIEAYLDEIVISIYNEVDKILDMTNSNKFTIITENRKYILLGQVEYFDGLVLFVLQNVNKYGKETLFIN